jgi:hypothetical protein
MLNRQAWPSMAAPKPMLFVPKSYSAYPDKESITPFVNPNDSLKACAAVLATFLTNFLARLSVFLNQTIFLPDAS